MKLSVYQDKELISETTIGEDSISSSVEEAQYYIGRSEDCHLVLEGKQVSRQHAIIKKNGNDWQLLNNSQHGMLLINGRPCDDKFLANGDLISIGPYEITVSLPGDYDSEQPAKKVENQKDLQEATSDKISSNENATPSSKDEKNSKDSTSTKGTGSKDNKRAVSPGDNENKEDLLDDQNSATEKLDNEKTEDKIIDPSSEKTSEGYNADQENQSEVADNNTPTEGASESNADFLESGETENLNNDIGADNNFDSSNASDSGNSLDSSIPTNENSDMGSSEGGLGSSIGGELGGELAGTGAANDPNNFETSTSGDPNTNNSDGNEEEDGKTKVVTSFVKYALKLFGEHAPYDEFVIKDSETYIGRDPKKCQIVLKDPEVSTHHAVLKKSNINIVLEDLNSSNGTILNGVRVNQAEVNNGDEFIIGSTSFTLIVKSELLSKEADALMPVEENQVMEVEEIVEETVDLVNGPEGAGASVGNTVEGGVPGTATGDAFAASGAAASTGASNSIISEYLKDPQKRKKLIIVVVALLGLYVFMSDDGKKDGGDQNKEKDKTAKSSDSSKKDGKSTTDSSGRETASKDKDKDKNGGTGSYPETAKVKKKLTPEEKEYLEAAYVAAKEYFDRGKYKEAELELNKISEVTEDGYKESTQLKKLVKEGLEQIAALETQKQKEIENKKKKEKLEELLKKAGEAVKEHKVELAEGLFNKILEIDPEQPDVNMLRMEINAWKKEQERIAVEQETKKANRKRKEDQIVESRNYYLKKNWFLAIDRLEKFLQIREMDQDLIEEATKMLSESRANIKNKVDPLLGKARSLKEGQDLKGAYETYQKILTIEPTNAEALNESSDIKENLDLKARKIYREGIISESLSLFEDAKEKFQEVQQVSPSDGAYNKRSKDKLKNYY